MAHPADDKPDEIGRLIQAQRLAIGMSRADAATRAEISEEWWREIEEGYVSGRGPSVRVFERAANAVGLTLTLSRT
jgi:transcriptional regulator with XRE-family HTH domain